MRSSNKASAYVYEGALLLGGLSTFRSGTLRFRGSVITAVQLTFGAGGIFDILAGTHYFGSLSLIESSSNSLVLLCCGCSCH